MSAAAPPLSLPSARADLPLRGARCAREVDVEKGRAGPSAGTSEAARERRVAASRLQSELSEQKKPQRQERAPALRANWRGRGVWLRLPLACSSWSRSGLAAMGCRCMRRCVHNLCLCVDPLHNSESTQLHSNASEAQSKPGRSGGHTDTTTDRHQVQRAEQRLGSEAAARFCMSSESIVQQEQRERERERERASTREQDGRSLLRLRFDSSLSTPL